MPTGRNSAYAATASSYDVVIRESAAGVMKAAAMPVTNRATISVQPSVAKPPSPEKARKTVSQSRNIRRRPSRSAARPPSSVKPA